MPKIYSFLHVFCPVAKARKKLEFFSVTTASATLNTKVTLFSSKLIAESSSKNKKFLTRGLPEKEIKKSQNISWKNQIFGVSSNKFEQTTGNFNQINTNNRSREKQEAKQVTRII